MSVRRFTTSSILGILEKRGFTKDRAANVLLALSTVSRQTAELESLASSLPIAALQDMEKSYKSPNLKLKDAQVKVITPDQRQFIVKGSDGETLQGLVLDGTDLKEYLECACGGNMTCSTCHVYVRSPSELGAMASEEEKDMIDLAWEPIENVSRLGCQLKLQKGVDLIVEIPKQAFNHFK